MSAITAIVRTDGRLPEADATKMIDAMAARAPDGIRVWSGGPAGLGHGALHTTAEAATERLPLARDGATFVITADARLDNRAELLRELQAHSGAGDGELILAAYERWGDACPERLLGDFAFAIWNARRQALFCACDRFAVKPLYWHRSNQLVAIATEIKALLAVDDVPRRLNERRLADFLTVHVEDPISTIYRDVYRLPAAHALTVDRDGVRVRRYWLLDPTRPLDFSSDADYEQAFRSAFMEAVSTRLRSHRPVTAMLSGGMDSSSIVVMARELLRAGGAGRLPLDTISASFSAVPRADEREYIDAVLELGGLEPHFVFPEKFGPLEDWEGAAWRGDEPELIPQRTIVQAVFAAATELGSNCVLAGDGGDDVVSHGVERLTDLARRGRWISLVRQAHAFDRRANFTPGTIGLLREFAISPFLPARVWTFRQRLRERGTGMPYWAGGVPLDPGFARRARLEERYEEESQRLRQPRDPRRAQSAVLSAPQFELQIFDRLAGLLSVEQRYPFLDSRLVELCVAVPPEQKLRDGYSRNLLRRSLQDLLPAKVRLRGGKGMPGAHVTHSLPTTGQSVMDRVIFEDPGPIVNYVDIDGVRKQYHRCLGGADFYEWNAVWRVVVGALWLSHTQSRGPLEN